MRKKTLRVVSAAALFDGHDVSINIFRRLLQARGLEVVHLGHNRSIQEVVSTAVEEDADAVLVSSYQGGHNEYFRYLVDSLRARDSGHILVFGGGGGVILPAEIEALQEYGVCRLYHAEDGRKMGIDGIADDLIRRIREQCLKPSRQALYRNLDPAGLAAKEKQTIARAITVLEEGGERSPEVRRLEAELAKKPENPCAVLGITGPGGSGKSSIIDELVNRFLKVSPDVTVAVLGVDPSRSRTGGALLGDRIRMNCVYDPRVYMRSFATRESASELSRAAVQAISVLKAAGFDFVLLETSGSGQRDHSVAEICDKSVYVMTGEYGAPTQLDKIDMLDLADFIAVNKCHRPGSEDALREVTLHYIRNHGIKVRHRETKSILDLELPVYATAANQFNNPGINQLFLDILRAFEDRGLGFSVDEKLLGLLSTEGHKDFSRPAGPGSHYLDDIADCIEKYHERAKQEIEAAESCYALKKSLALLEGSGEGRDALPQLRQQLDRFKSALSPGAADFLEQWPKIRERYAQEEVACQVHGQEVRVKSAARSLAGSRIPKVALPESESWGELLRFYFKENLPGSFPFTAGVFPFRSTAEEPTRQFAGEGTPERTNRRLHYLCRDSQARRLSIAFDPLTLYGENPAESPDVFGKIGESGVSVCTLDDMKKLLAGFDTADPHFSISMTINGPAPIILAMYFNAAADQKAQKLSRELGPAERIELFRKLRGTVQADILKEVQGQNTCIYSLDFALKMMADVQQYFSRNDIRHFYSVSISGYHMAEAGATPITQLAFTLANGFHYLEYFRSLGLEVSRIARNLSFFFSNGMEPEYAVIGRVARRIWAIALRERYGADADSQKLKYHIQTSGRSLHAQDIHFNDIRTTLQALFAMYDNCNSLHTNSYDEAVTTPTEESLRCSMAIQLILAREFGMLKSENPNQGAYIVEQLTDLVEKEVLEEFRRLSFRGGVLGAIEKQYQRGKIQEESLRYEELKESGEYPVVGVNTFIDGNARAAAYDRMEVRRATPEEKKRQLRSLEAFEKRNRGKAEAALDSLREVVLRGGNIFEELLATVRCVSLGRITGLLYELGGRFRRDL